MKHIGIIHEKSGPRCAEQNGSIESEIRTIKDTAYAMLKRNSSAEFLWAEAVAASVYVLNRVLNKQRTSTTAYEGIFNR